MTENVTTGTHWRLTGDWFDVCKCAIPCPCTFAQPPTYGDCEGVLVWHIREGSFGDVRLDDLNVLMLGSFVGNVWAGEHTDAYAAVFLDERADEQQRGAFGAIFGGEAGGWPARFGEMFQPEMRGMDFVPIAVEIDEDLGLFSRWASGTQIGFAEANGVPAVVAWEDGELTALGTLDLGEGGITGIRIVRNPDKLTFLATRLRELSQNACPVGSSSATATPTG